MIKQNFVIICESAIIEKDSNNLYLLGIFENIITPKLPAIHPKFAVVTSFEGGSDEYDHKIVIRHEDGSEAAKLEGKIKFSENQKAQYIGRFIGFPFTKPGKYTFEIYLNENMQPLTSSLNIREE